MVNIPVITIDGPSGSGKGTVAFLLAQQLGWHLLDSGAIYRAIAWAVKKHAVDIADDKALQQLLKDSHITVEWPSGQAISNVFCDGKDISTVIREAGYGQLASSVSERPLVRQAVLQYQRDFCRAPGLIADGRDMGTVVFPDADIKVFLIADLRERAKRRYMQLQQSGINVSLRDIQNELAKRDQRDREREIAPTKPAEDAIELDSTRLTPEQVVEKVMELVHKVIL